MPHFQQQPPIDNIEYPDDNKLVECFSVIVGNHRQLQNRVIAFFSTRKLKETEKKKHTNMALALRRTAKGRMGTGGVDQKRGESLSRMFPITFTSLLPALPLIPVAFLLVPSVSDYTAMSGAPFAAKEMHLPRPASFVAGRRSLKSENNKIHLTFTRYGPSTSAYSGRSFAEERSRSVIQYVQRRKFREDDYVLIKFAFKERRYHRGKSCIKKPICR